jgi:hypothetical protein
MVTCDQVTRAAGDFAERLLGLQERLMVLAHIAMCRGCRAYLEQFRLTLLALHSLPQPATQSSTERLLDHFREHSGRAT